MDENYNRILGEVFCDVCEKFAFMFGEAAPDESVGGVTSQCIQAAMSFKGPFCGRLTITAPRELCPVIAANVLGVEPGDQSVPEGAADSLKELLSVTCGHLLTALAGDKPAFDTSVPTWSEMDPLKWAELRAGSGTMTFVVDGYPVLVQLVMESRSGR